MSLYELEEKNGVFMSENGDFQWGVFTIWSFTVTVTIGWITHLSIL